MEMNEVRDRWPPGPIPGPAPGYPEITRPRDPRTADGRRSAGAWRRLAGARVAGGIGLVRTYLILLTIISNKVRMLPGEPWGAVGLSRGAPPRPMNASASTATGTAAKD